MATTSPPNNIPIARPAMSPEVYLVWDRASTSFPHQLSIANRLINHKTCMHANGTNCGGLLEFSCTVKISLTPVRKSLLGGLHHDAEIVLVITNTFNDGDSKSDFAWKGRCQDIFDHSLGFCCRSHEDS